MEDKEMMTNRTFLTVHGVIYTVFAFALFLSQHTSIFLGGI
ncbi:hypothetical protein CGI68_25270, partial [Vibrio parahaemolyticus]